MASSSTTTTFITPIQQKFDVFISFRGTDTRDSITSHVYDALCSAKIETFIDNDLHRGDDVSDALLRTIADSKISVIIFSENYGASRWCLDELVEIMKCNKENGQIVIPVFFKVDASDVRKQSGPFGQALARHEGHPKIQTWRDALTKAGNLSGWVSKDIRLEAVFVKRIVKDISDKLSSCSFGPTFRIFTIADPKFSMSIRNGKLILASTNSNDSKQEWYKDEKYALGVTNQMNHKTFALVNKGTGQAIKHATDKFRPVQLVHFNPNSLDKSLLWTNGDEGDEGNSSIWVLNNNLDLALDAQAANTKAFDGTSINMWEWNGGINQQWCIVPNVKADRTIIKH